MRHTIITVLLTLGVVGGLAAGFHSLRHHGPYAYGHHRRHFEEHVAAICVKAALETQPTTPARQSGQVQP